MPFLLMIAVGLIGANSLILSPIAAEVAASLGIENPAMVMNAAAFYGAGVALSALTVAPLADRIGADSALKLSLFVIAAALGLTASASSLTVLTVGHTLTGIGIGVALPAAYTMAAVIARPGEEARTIGIVLTGWTVAMVVGVTFGAYVAEYFGWRTVFVSLSLGVLGILIVLLLAQMPKGPRSKRTTTPISALRVPGVVGALFSVAVFSLGFYGTYGYLGTHVTEVLDRPVSDGGNLTLIYGVGFGAAMIFDRHIDRIGPRRGLIIMFSLLAALLFAAYWIAPSYVGLAGFVFVWGIVNHLALNMTVNRLTSLDPSQRGAIMGLNSAVMYIGMTLGTAGYRPLFLELGLGACFVASGLISLTGVIEAHYARRKERNAALTT